MKLVRLNWLAYPMFCMIRRMETAVNIIIQWILHMVLFVPLMAVDLKRAAQKRTDLCIPPFVTMTTNVFKSDNEPGLSAIGNFTNRFVKSYYVPVRFFSLIATCVHDCVAYAAICSIRRDWFLIHAQRLHVCVLRLCSAFRARSSRSLSSWPCSSVWRTTASSTPRAVLMCLRSSPLTGRLFPALSHHACH